jgi:DNA-binding Lrp family transcriptional regulator
MNAHQQTDLRILRVLATKPRITVTELAERVGVTRNTAQARVSLLERKGVLRSGDRNLDYAALGLEVTAFVTMRVAQGRLHDAVTDLAQLPYVLEAHAIVGDGDLLARVVARNPQHLHQVIDSVLTCRGILRCTTTVGVTEQIAFRVGPLLDSLIE